MGRQLLRSEALASSQIEGLSISHRKLAEADLSDREGHHKAADILGAIRAMGRAMAVGGEARLLDIETVTMLHAELATVPPLDQIAGQLREQASWIGGSTPATAEFVGPPHGEVEPLLRDLCEFMNREDISPIPQAAIAHASSRRSTHSRRQCRVGRCLIHVLFRRRGVAPQYVPPISSSRRKKDAYVPARGLPSGELDQWVSYFSRAVGARRGNAVLRLGGRAQEDWRDRGGRCGATQPCSADRLTARVSRDHRGGGRGGDRTLAPAT